MSTYPISLIAALGSQLGQTMRGDGAPYWLEGRHNSLPEPAAEVRRWRRLLVKTLDANCGRHSPGDDLRQRLQACSLIDPCGSGACPVCWRVMRRLLVHASRRLFKKRGGYRFVTCISAADIVMHGRMNAVDPLADAGRRSTMIATRRRRDHLHAADPFDAVESRVMRIATLGNVRIFGSLDISSNEHDRQRFRPHYAPHGHLLVPIEDFMENAWKGAFPFAPPEVPKPIEAPLSDGGSRLVPYIFHPIVDRRDSIAPHVTADGTWKRANTRDGKPLRRPQRLELALMLDRVGIEARIISHGYELRTDGSDVWMVEVDRRRANELLLERRQRRAALREEHLRRERERRHDEHQRFRRFLGMNLRAREIGS